MKLIGMAMKGMKTTTTISHECPSMKMLEYSPLLPLLLHLAVIHLCLSFARPKLWTCVESPKSYWDGPDLDSTTTLPGLPIRAETWWRPMYGRDWLAARGSYCMGQIDARPTDHTNIGLAASLIWAQEVVATLELSSHLTQRSWEDTEEVTK